MIVSGAVKKDDKTERELYEVEEEERVILIVRDIKPPFLDGRIVFTTQTDPVQVVKDPTSDFA